MDIKHNNDQSRVPISSNHMPTSPKVKMMISLDDNSIGIDVKSI